MVIQDYQWTLNWKNYNMPIQLPTRNNIPYLTGYSPIQLPPGEAEALDITEMFSYNISNELLRGNINYEVGAEFNPTYLATIQNLTSNTTLDIIFYFSNKALSSVDAIHDGDVSTVNKIILPNESLSVEFVLNKSILDSSSNYEKYDFNFSVKISNIEHGYVVLKKI